MTNDERIEALRGLVMSHVWRDVVVPMYQQRLRNEVQALIENGDDTHRGAIDVLRQALSPTPSSAVRRGRIRALQALIDWPQGEVEQHELDKVRKAVHNEEQLRWDHYATWGRSSPIAPPDYPANEGET